MSADSATGPRGHAADSTHTWQPLIDAVCDRFERAWRTGPEPRIEGYLEDGAVPLSRRAALFRDLLAVERELRERRGDRPGAAEYLGRFPGYSLIIRAAFGEERIGDYDLIGPIGEGGMGIVYRARHRGMQRDVALKVIRPRWLDDSSAVDRFRLESQLAARLEHEHIVPVYEAGQADGQHFYAMRYIAGRSLADAIDGKPVAGQAAARYIEQVARAVDHAHTRNVLHRDIKPRNILIDESDRAYITDFGLAKLMGQAGGTLTTGTGGLGSPPYMSPEQWRDPARAGHGSDIYSLGATLFEALTGRPPFRAENLAQLHVQVLEKEPPRPRALNPACDRDLETICLKCLEKEPARRYASALELADDLRCYLDGRPIKARRVGVPERAGKWVRKHPTATALAVVSVGAAVALGASVVLKRALDDAEQGYRRAREVVDKVSYFGERRLRDRPEQLKELLAILAEENNDFLNRRIWKSAYAGEAAGTLSRMARLMDLVGSKPEALEAHRRALPLRRRVAEAHPDDPKRLGLLAETLHNIGVLQNALGRLDEAKGSYDEALRIRSRLREKYPEDREVLADLARSHGFLGDWELANNRLKEADESYTEATRLRERLVKDDPSDWVAKFQLARSYANHGRYWHERGDRKQAVSWHGRAIERQKELHALASGKPLRFDDEARGFVVDSSEIAADLAGSHYEVGVLHAEDEEDDRGRRSAIDEHRRAEALLRKLMASDPGVARFRGELALALNYLAFLLGTRGEIDGAKGLVDEAEKLLAGAPGEVRYQAGLARNRATAGELERLTRNVEAARKLLDGAITDQDRLYQGQLGNSDLRRDLDWMKGLRKKLDQSGASPQ